MSHPSATEKSRYHTEEEARLVDECIDSAETIITCAQHQKRIVDDILTMSKLDSKLLAVTPCTVDPIEIAENALKMFEVEARRVDLNLNLVIDESFKNLGLKYLDFDPSRVRQVLINLLTNALKFTKSRPVRHVEVRIKASRTRPTDDSSLVQYMPRSCSKESEHEQPALVGRTNPIYLAFDVKDSGKGLGEDEMSHLFKKFQQANEKTHVKYGGSGLGLFISRRLTELQNGAIGVSSKKGVGSIFAFFIEAYIPTEASRLEAEAAATAASATASSEFSSEMNLAPAMTAGTWPIRTDKQNPGANSRIDGILIVEDNIINQRITRRGLTDRGFTVDVANHGVEALEKLEASQRRSTGSIAEWEMSPASSSALSLPSSSRETSSRKDEQTQGPMQFNLILMDIEMPVQDGLTCTRRIRQLEREGRTFSERGGRIPIIAVSANARPEQIAEAKNAGCDDMLVKPYRMHELVEKMQIVIRRMDGLSPNSPPR
jgi:CheY-like chemotaxis protein